MQDKDYCIRCGFLEGQIKFLSLFKDKLQGSPGGQGQAFVKIEIRVALLYILGWQAVEKIL